MILSVGTLEALGEKLLGLSARRLAAIYGKRSWMRHCAREAAKTAGVPYARRPICRWLRRKATWELLSRPADHSPGEVVGSLREALRPGRTIHASRWTLEERGRMATILVPAIADAIYRYAPIQKAIDALHGQLSDVGQQVGEIHRAVIPAEWEAHLSVLPLGVRLALRQMDATDSKNARRLAEVLSTRREPANVVFGALASAEAAWLRDGSQQYLTVLGEFAAVYQLSERSSEKFEQAAEAGLSPVRHLVRAAAAALEAGNVERASDLVRRAEALQPGDLYAQMVRAGIDNQLEEIEQVALEAASADPTDPILSITAARVLHYGLGKTDEAEDCLRRLVREYPDHTTGLLELAKILRRKATTGYQLERPRLLAEALELSARAKATRRRTQVHSADALVVETECLLLMDRDDEALSRCLGEQEGGSAESEEALDGEVVRLAIGIALDLGRNDLVRRLVEGNPDVRSDLFVRAQLALAGIQGARSDVGALVGTALDAATTPWGRLQCLEMMASIGTWPMPGIDDIARQDPLTAERLQATAEIEAGKLAEAIERLRRLKPFPSGIFVRLLARAYERNGDMDAAVSELRDGARDLLDPTLRARCVVLLMNLGRLDAAAEEGQAALRDMHSDSPLRRQVHRWLRDVAWQSTNWIEAERYARMCLLDDPQDATSGWALVGALWNSQRGLDSWREWQHYKPAVARPQEAVVWIQLASSYAEARTWLEQAVEIAEQFETDPEVGGAFFYATMLAPADATDDALHDRIVSRNQSIIEQHSDYIGVKAFPAEDFLPVVEGLGAQLRARSERLRSTANLVLFQRAPIGLMAIVSGHLYAEILLTRAVGCLPVEASDQAATHIAAAALEGDVVVDTSALVIAAAVPAVWRHARGALRAISISALQRGDLSQTVRALSTQTVAVMGWDPSGQRVVISDVDGADLLKVRAEAKVADEYAESCHVEQSLRCEPLKGLTADASVWLSSIDLAIARGVPLWVDDLGLRLLARQNGVQAFSSLDVMAALTERGTLPEEGSGQIRRAMVSERIVDIGVSDQDILDMARADTWHRGVSALQLARPARWNDPGRALQVLTAVLDSVLTEQPNEVRAWVCAAGVGVGAATRMGGADQAIAQVGVVALLHTRMSPGVAPGVIAGTRDAARQLDLSDPLPALVRIFNDRCVARFGSTMGAGYASQMLSQLEAEDRALVMRAIISP